MAFILALLPFLFVSCGKNANSEKASSSKKIKKKSDDKVQAFIYTVEKRKDKYVPTESQMVFSKKIGSVNEYEFQGNQSLQEVWIGQQIQHIANGAFKNCTALQKVHFEGFVPVINDESFMGCENLQSLNVDASTLGLDAFKDCKSLQSAIFGEHIWWIREGAFGNCTSLKRVISRITMAKLEDGAFEGCTAIEEFSVPNDVKNRMFGMMPAPEKWRKIYVLSTEFFPMPKNCTPNDQCTLYVPDAFLDKFKGAEGWNQFGSIEPLSKSKYYTAEGLWK